MSIFSRFSFSLNMASGSLVMSLLLLGILFLTTYSVKAPQDVKLVAKTATTLYVGDLSQGETVRRGETVTVLGQRIDPVENDLMFWVTTKNGERGYVRQEAFDNDAIVYNLNDADSLMSVNEGDTVKILSRSDEYTKKYKIRTKEGKRYQLSKDQIISLTGNEMLKHELSDRRGYFISRKKFETLYFGKTFDEIEQLYRKALFVKKDGNVTLAEYELYIFDPADGIRYEPTIRFENNIAVSCTLDEAIEENKFFLKYLPFVDKIIDIDMFSNLISGNTYSYAMLEDDAIWKVILSYIALAMFLVLFLSWLFLTNHTISLFLCGLLSLRYPLYFLNNKAVLIILYVVSLLSTYIWMVLILCYPFHWWYFIPILFYVTSKVLSRFSDFFSDFPKNRCPKCKSLYKIYFERTEVIKEYKQWREITERGKLLDSTTHKWKTWTDVTKTTTYSSGRTDVNTSKENERNHSKTVNTYQFNVYKVLYFVNDCKNIYTCRKCAYEEYSYKEKLKELEREYLRNYAN